ncbi:MAG TPA: hypothetical protein VJK09_02745 [Candidatus Paceibacterota bacterium]
MDLDTKICVRCGAIDDPLQPRLAEWEWVGESAHGRGGWHCPTCNLGMACEGGCGRTYAKVKAGHFEDNQRRFICHPCWDNGKRFSVRPSESIITKEKERRGELAILFLKARLLKDSLGSATSIREIGNVAKQVGVSTEEAKAFAEWLVRSIIDEAFLKEGSGFKGGVSNTDT